MEIFLQIGIFCVATFGLIKSADYFIQYVEKLSDYMGIPQFITGVLLVSIGTSLPELATSILAVMHNETDLIIGNILGSNIANVLLGLGLVSFIANRNIRFEQDIFQVHFPIFILSTSLIVITLMDNVITPAEGVFFFGILGAYMWFLFDSSKEKRSIFHHRPSFHWSFIAVPIICLGGLAFTSELVITSILKIAELAGLSSTALAATLVALGTSLPEMIVVYGMVRRGGVKLADMAIGNILGSNIFNLVFILAPVAILAGITGTQVRASSEDLWVLIPFIIATAFIFWGSAKDKEITRQEGFAMAFMYFLFLGMLYGWV